MSNCRFCNNREARSTHEHCPQCSRGFRTPTALLSHQRELGHFPAPPLSRPPQSRMPIVGQAQKMPTCDICFDIFGSQNRLLAHVNEKHPYHNATPRQRQAPVVVAPNLCMQCGLQFPSRNKMMQHVRQEEHYGEPKQEEEPEEKEGPEGVEEQAANELRCKNCFREFRSRTKLFVHIREMNHYEEAKEPPKFKCTECHTPFASRDQLDQHFADTHLNGPEVLKLPASEFYEEESDGSSVVSEDLGVDSYTPQAFQTWDPFPESDAYVMDEDIEKLDEYIEEFNATQDWDEKYRITVEKIMKPFIEEGRPRFTEWPEKEIKQIFQDAQALPKLPTDDTRFICHELIKDVVKSNCDHEEECWCYFEASAGAGIPGLYKPGGSIRKDRRACIDFMHRLLAELLITLTEAEMENWDSDEKWLLFSAIKWTNPDRNEEYDEEYDEQDDDERLRYLFFDTEFKRLSMGMYDEEGKGVRTKNDPQLLRLVGTIGRRMLALGICCVGDGHYFVKKQPIQYWNISGLMSDDNQKGSLLEVWENEAEEGRHIRDLEQAKTHLLRNPRPNVEQPRYPTRVINTHTYEFEEDSVLYRGSYAILSHTWTQRGREVSFDAVQDVFAEAKEEQLEFHIKKLDASLDEAEGIQIDEITHEKKELERELEELKWVRKIKLHEKEDKKPKPPAGNAPLNTKKTMLGRVNQDAVATVQAHDIGKWKLLKAIQEARKLGYDYIWVDSCCINKPNNTELVEAISSMGDWYKNAKTCLVYLEDFDGSDIYSDKSRKKAHKNRYATRGWTLQEIVMAPEAIFFNKSWKIIADTKNPKVDRETLARICRVPANLLCCGGAPNVGASLILELATLRRTFKPEDRAYSLMGMLGVRIRADYGEGQSKALSRLFEAIIRTTSDVSIFNWTGKYAASSENARSMYPNDFDGYQRVTQLIDDNHDGEEGDFDYAMPGDVKPATALSTVNLDHFGVHARFDICEIDVVIEGDNEHALETVCELEQQLKEMAVPGMTTMSSSMPAGPANTYCSCRCDFTLPNGNRLEAEVLVHLPALKGYLECLSNSRRNSDTGSKWAMARFAGVKNANWFLCDIRMNNGTTDSNPDSNSAKGLFSDVLLLQNGGKGRRGNDGRGDNEIGYFMQYLESSGFTARRLAMTWNSQHFFPTEAKYFKSAYLWVG